MGHTEWWEMQKSTKGRKGQEERRNSKNLQHSHKKPKE